MLTRRVTTFSQLPRLLEILLAHLPEELRQPRVDLTMEQCKSFFMADTRAADQTRYEIFHLERDGVMIGGAFAMLRPDGTFLALQPVTLPTEPEATRHGIYEVLLEFADKEHARLVMILVDCQQFADETLFHQFDFKKISELLNLNAERAVFPAKRPNSRLTFCPYKNELWQEMVALVEKTYENTHDFPGLTGIGSAESILCGYQESHEFDSSLWYFIEFQSQIIGVLLLTQMEHAEHLELTYLGLILEFRGRGLSHEIVQFAQFVAFQRNESHLLVSVDVANTPALNAYLQNGFHIHDQKEIYVRFL